MHPLESSFEKFLEAIRLGRRSDERINSAWGGVLNFLKREYGISDSAVIMQGSYANGTAIRPNDPQGEYDLDILAVIAGAGSDPAEVLRDLKDRLARNSTYGPLLDKSREDRPCARLNYARQGEAFGFHVDITPARPSQTEGEFEIPKRGDGWRATSPLAYTWWCGATDGQSPPSSVPAGVNAMPPDFRRTVRMLKRWRDFHDDSMIKSIVLQVLIGYSMPVHAATDAERILTTLRTIGDRFAGDPSGPPAIPNPVLPSEDLSKRWKPEDYKRFRSELAEAIEAAEEAVSTSLKPTAHARWREVFGDDFPPHEDERGKTPPPPPPGYGKRQQARTGERYGSGQE